MSEPTEAPVEASLLDVLSVLERNLPRAVAAASLGSEARSALSSAPELLSALLLSVEKAERALLLARLSCVSQEVGALAKGLAACGESAAKQPALAVTLAKAKALSTLVPLLVRTGVLATALEHPPALARLLLLAQRESVPGDFGFPLLGRKKAAYLAEHPGMSWQSLAEWLEDAERAKWSRVAVNAIWGEMTGGLQPESSREFDEACRLAEMRFTSLSGERLRAMHARYIAEELFTGDELQPWPEVEMEEERQMAVSPAEATNVLNHPWELMEQQQDERDRM